MKQKPTHLTALTCAVLIGSAVLSQGAVLWSDNFNGYSDGSLTHQGAGIGTGWGGSWYASTGANVSSGVITGSGTVKRDLGVTFGSVGPTLWISFDWGQVTAQNSWGGITFFNADDNAEFGKIGNADNTGFWNLSGAVPTSTVSTQGMKTGVAKITLSGDANPDLVQLWVGATGSPVDVSGTALSTSTSMNLDSTRRLRIMGGDAQTFDNLVIGTTMLDVGAIPEPSAALLGGLGMLALLRRRR